MWQIQIPLVDLFNRLVELNEDRNRQYTEAISYCSEPDFREHFERMAIQSSDYIRQLRPYLVSSNENRPPTPAHYAISADHWERLRMGVEINDVFMIPLLVHKIEEEFSLLYANICQMLPVQHPAEGIVLNQYDSILKTNAKNARYYFNYN